MFGRVDAGAREAMLPLRVLGGTGEHNSAEEVHATVDTGLTGALCLPPT